MANTDFDKIDNWLKQNAEKIANHSLQAPATENQFYKLETVIGKSLPTDFKALYLWHNGLTDEENSGSLFFGMDFFSIDQIMLEYSREKEYASLEGFSFKEVDPEIDSSTLFNSNWVKFGFDGSHTALYLDLSPTEQGKYGQIIFIDNEYQVGILVANSTSELIAGFANDLENNLYHLDPDALEDDNHFLGTDNSIDLINWHTRKNETNRNNH